MRRGRRCLYCGKPLTGREWDVGACEACIDARVKEYRPLGAADNGEWKSVDCGPRMKDICAPEEVDIVGVALLYHAVFRGGSHYGEKLRSYDKVYWAACTDCPDRKQSCQHTCKHYAEYMRQQQVAKLQAELEY